MSTCPRSTDVRASRTPGETDQPHRSCRPRRPPPEGRHGQRRPLRRARRARWAVVDPGPMRAEKFVPVEGAYVTEGGDMVIPYAKDQVKHAPKASRDHVLDSGTESQLETHYELGGSMN